jgi:hypothetical protein
LKGQSVDAAVVHESSKVKCLDLEVAAGNWFYLIWLGNKAVQREN